MKTPLPPRMLERLGNRLRKQYPSIGSPSPEEIGAWPEPVQREYRRLLEAIRMHQEQIGRVKILGRRR